MAKDTRQIRRNLNRLTKEINDRAFLVRLAKKAIQLVYNRVKSGYGVNTDDEDSDGVVRVRLKKLSPNYIKTRQGLLRFYTNKNGQIYAIGPDTPARKKFLADRKPRLGEYGSPAKSNLTLSGQMLESVVFRINKDGAEIYIPDTYRRRVNSKVKEQPTTNREIAEYVSVDRPFFALTKSEMRVLDDMIERHVNRIIKRYF